VRRAPLRIDPSDLALEIVSIVIAIVLATAVGELVEHVRAQARTHEALVQIRQEIVADDAGLRRNATLHRNVWNAFRDAVTRARGHRMDFDEFAATFARSAPHGLRPFVGSTTAWDLARTSTVLADVPYDVRATIQRRYAELDGLRDTNAIVLAHLENAPAEEHPNFYFTAVALVLSLADVVYSEQRLAADDAAALRALDAAGAR